MIEIEAVYESFLSLPRAEPFHDAIVYVKREVLVEGLVMPKGYYLSANEAWHYLARSEVNGKPYFKISPFKADKPAKREVKKTLFQKIKGWFK